ncbi:putative reverse transcriptase, partial [Purpureocillium lilacinum]
MMPEFAEVSLAQTVGLESAADGLLSNGPSRDHGMGAMPPREPTSGLARKPADFVGKDIRAAEVGTAPRITVHRNPPILRSAQPAAAAAMASASSSPPHNDDPFDLGPRTPSGLARGARVALLRNSPATREGEIGVSRSALRTAYTPSSPLHAVSYAAATEGAQRAVHFDSSEPDPQPGDGPVSVASAADKLVVAQNEVYSAKLAVFRAFCSSFDDTAKQFTSGPALQFAQKFSSSFLQYWTDVLAGTHTNLPPTKPSYAAAVGARRPAPAAAGTTADPVSAAPQNQWQQQLPPRRQGQRKPLPPPTDDFRVFARLRPDHTADMSRSFAVRTHIADKLGIDRSRIPQAHPCKTGWAIRAADLATRDLLTERQAEWASDISAEIVEKRQEWYTYAVQGCPRRFNNIFGEAIDDEKAIRDEVATQTGQTPERVITAKQDSDQRPTRTLIISFAKEVKHYWRLFDTTSYARLIVKTKPPKQCDNCWDYHSRYSCGRQARCKNCGKTGHAQDTCTATQQCANCHGPHAVDFPQCPARPKKVNGAFHSLNRPEKKLVQIMGKRLFKQFTAKPASPPRDQSMRLESDSATASDTTSASSRSTPTTSDAITPEPERENRASRPSETPSASSAAPAAPNSQASPTPSSGSSSSGRQNTAASASPIKPTSATPMNSADSVLLRASSARSERSNSPPVRQSIEMSEEPNERQHRDKRLFRVFQANVGKNGPSHDCALALADAERYEVILLQEPWTQVRDSRCLTKTHPAYDTYSPVSTWEDIDTRPRVMTYIRRGARLLADQQRPALSRDILWLVVNGVTLVNVYREPNLDTALEVLFAWPIPSQCIIAGDFNARLHTWQIGPSRGHGGIIAEWAAENDLDLLNPINTPTNSARRRSRPHGWRGCCAEGRHALLWLGRRGSWDPDRKDHHYEAGWTRPMPSPPPPPAAQGAGWADYGLHAKKVKMQGRMLRKAARKRFEEGQTTLEEAEPYRILTATMPVDALTADWSMGSNRPIQEKHVNALYTIFQRGDMKRARYPLAVLSTRSEVQCMLHEMGYDGDTPDADDVPSFDKWLLVNGRPVELLDGQHRVAPLKRIVSGSGSGKQELYWPCNIYDRGMPHATAAEADVVLWLSSILDLKNEPLPILTESDRVNYDGGHRKRRKLATLVTMDVQGAFDTVMRNRLILRLRQQGWPPHLVRWAGSFMQDRSAAIRFQDVTTPASPLRCGLAQGSPASPILFALYIAPIYRLGNSEGRFGYADDTAMLRTGRTLEETTALASRDMEELLVWGAANGVTFDPDKTEVMHFSSKASPTPNTALFPAPSAEQSRPVSKPPYSTAQKRVKHLVLRLDKVLRHALRAALPVWKTTPIPAMHREAGTPPATIALAAQQIRFSARLKSLDGRHPLVKRASRKPPRARHTRNPSSTRRVKPTFQSRLQRTDQLLPKCHRPALLPRRYSDTEASPLQTANKAETAGDFLEWLGNAAAATLIVYSDGSQLPNGAVGFGFTVHRDKQSLVQGSGR